MNSLDILGPPQKWIPTQKSILNFYYLIGKECGICSKHFNFTNRRHHCRVFIFIIIQQCGKIVCNDCSKSKRKVIGFREQQRVCDNCIKNFEDAVANALRRKCIINFDFIFKQHKHMKEKNHLLLFQYFLNIIQKSEESFSRKSSATYIKSITNESELFNDELFNDENKEENKKSIITPRSENNDRLNLHFPSSKKRFDYLIETDKYVCNSAPISTKNAIKIGRKFSLNERSKSPILDFRDLIKLERSPITDEQKDNVEEEEEPVIIPDLVLPQVTSSDNNNNNSEMINNTLLEEQSTCGITELGSSLIRKIEENKEQEPGEYLESLNKIQENVHENLISSKQASPTLSSVIYTPMSSDSIIFTLQNQKKLLI